MRFLLFSDSHGDIRHMVKAVKKNKDIDLIIHLGDMVSDALKLKELYPDIRFEQVSGNNDWTRSYPTEKMLVLEGKNIFITHGHLYNVKLDYRRIVSRGKAANADAVFFGHTHMAEEFFSDGMLLLNPGSIARPLHGSNPTYCLVEIKEGKILPRFVGFG